MKCNLILAIGPGELEELKRSFTEAYTGNWMPLLTISLLISIIVFLAALMIRSYLKQNDKRHTDNEQLIKEISKSNLRLSHIVTEHNTELKNLRSS